MLDILFGGLRGGRLVVYVLLGLVLGGIFIAPTTIASLPQHLISTSTITSTLAIVILVVSVVLATWLGALVHVSESADAEFPRKMQALGWYLTVLGGGFLVIFVYYSPDEHLPTASTLLRSGFSLWLIAIGVLTIVIGSQLRKYPRPARIRTMTNVHLYFIFSLALLIGAILLYDPSPYRNTGATVVLAIVIAYWMYGVNNRAKKMLRPT